MNLLNHPLKPVFVSVFLIGCMVSTAITFILPQTFASTVRIKLTSRSAGESGSLTHNLATTWIPAIESEDLMESVARQLDLPAKWSKRYGNGDPMKIQEVAGLLLSRINVKTEADTALIKITVYNEDPQEAAAIANSIAPSLQELFTKGVTSEDGAGHVTQAPAVETVEPAVPGTAPVKPNIPLNITLGVIGSVILAFGVTAVASALSGVKGMRWQNLTSP